MYYMRSIVRIPVPDTGSFYLNLVFPERLKRNILRCKSARVTVYSRRCISDVGKYLLVTPAKEGLCKQASVMLVECTDDQCRPCSSISSSCATLK